MPIEVRPATVFEDVATMLGPKRPDASVCWCLSYRIPPKENDALRGTARGEKVASLLAGGPIGVLAYDGDEVVGWAAVAPRAVTAFARSRTIPRVDDLDVWSVWCIRVRPGHRGQGVSHPLLAGAVEYARSQGAPAIEGYPVDNRGERVNATMAYVGTRALFERAGFVQVAETTSVLDGFPRVVMRLVFAEPPAPDAGREEVPAAAGDADLGFAFTVRKGGDVVILHHGRVAATLRGRQAQAFLAAAETGDESARQQRMARLTGKDKRGNERLARQHPRNTRR